MIEHFHSNQCVAGYDLNQQQACFQTTCGDVLPFERGPNLKEFHGRLAIVTDAKVIVIRLEKKNTRYNTSVASSFAGA